MKVLVTGREGQVARSLAERSASHPGLTFEFAARPELDLADPASVRATVERSHADVIVSAAAYTAVDAAEDDEATARAVNGAAPGVLAKAASDTGARIVHLSTDYVFDGSGRNAYAEDNPVSPLGVYGRTKLEGEEAVRAATDAHVIVRTAWVYSPFGKNFVKTMLRLAADRDELAVVDDQHGNPTSALDIADAVLTVLDAWQAGADTGIGRTYHMAGTGDATWCGFARHILAESARLGGPTASVRAITTVAFPTKARRPANSRLDSSLFQRDFGYHAPHWMQSSSQTVERLLQTA